MQIWHSGPTSTDNNIYVTVILSSSMIMQFWVSISPPVIIFAQTFH